MKMGKSANFSTKPFIRQEFWWTLQLKKVILYGLLGIFCLDVRRG